MIDEKKIEEAAINYSQSLRENEILSFAFRDFKEGARWAIKQFLKDLWYSAEEVPKCKGKGILIKHKVLDKIEIGDYHIEYDSFILGKVFKNKEDWEEFKDTGYDCVDSWLYIDDLLPKKGGEKC